MVNRVFIVTWPSAGIMWGCLGLTFDSAADNGYSLKALRDAARLYQYKPVEVPDRFERHKPKKINAVN